VTNRTSIIFVTLISAKLYYSLQMVRARLYYIWSGPSKFAIFQNPFYNDYFN